MICPAYQSAFIYDKNELRKRFSYFQEDSTPKILMASKTKYLIAEPISYRKKLRMMQTVAMKPVNPVVPDSLTMGKDDLIAEMEGEDGVVPGCRTGFGGPLCHRQHLHRRCATGYVGNLC
jgi:hypothetical protein